MPCGQTVLIIWWSHELMGSGQELFSDVPVKAQHLTLPLLLHLVLLMTPTDHRRLVRP